MNKNICKIPIRATYKISDDSKPLLISAEYADIPADVMARFFIKKFGITSIVKFSE